MDRNIPAHGMKTPTSTKSGSTPSGKLTGQPAATPPAHTPRTPGLSSRTDPHKSTPRPPSHAATPLSSRGMMYHGSRTPLPSSHSRPVGASSSSRSASAKQRLENDPQRTESGHSQPKLQRSRSIVRDADEDRKRKIGESRVLSSTSLNVPTPSRRTGLSHKRLSADSKTPTPVRTSFGRTVTSSKLSLGSATPTPRRSSINNPRHSTHILHTPYGSSGYVTPEVIMSPASQCLAAECQHGKAESTKVSVGVRIRPFSSREEALPNSKSAIGVVGNNIRVTGDNGTVHTFAYDHCFWSCDETHPRYASQEDVYTHLAHPLLEKAYEGYNTCLFAYGQTSSGKSYTMLGEEGVSQPNSGMSVTAGVIPRFCRELFDRAHQLHLQNPPKNQLPQNHVEVEVSYIEIYNERIYDLLGSGSGISGGGGGGGGGGERREALRVREHPDTGPYVEGVACHLVSSYESLQSWLMLGNKERSIAATGLNDKSSRSHAVFTIKLTQVQVEDVEGEQLESSKVSVINLVDLAGSERLATSQGDRLKEGVCINKSLFTLGKVITALAESEEDRRSFIPYRESVLTYLLKESLGGNSRTAMIATVSPSSVHVEETLSTLRYAQQARKIVNHNYVNEDPTALIIRSLKEEVERLRLQQLQKSPSMLFDGEDSPDEDLHNQSSGDSDKDREALTIKENAMIEKEKEMNRIIKEREEEISALQDQLRYHKLLNDRSKSLEQRLQDTEAQQQQALESLHRLGVAYQNDKGPVLINLNEDPQLSETLSYRLENGTTTVGHSHCDLNLNGLHTPNVHCSIANDKGLLKLYPRDDGDTYVNGKLVQSPLRLHHNDRLVLAGLYYFRVSSPPPHTDLPAAAHHKEARKLDFYFTRDELLKEQQARIQREAELAVAASKAEMEQEMQHQMEQLMSNVKEAESQLNERQDMVMRLQGNQWKLEEEKRLLEEQIKKDRLNMNSLNLPLPPAAKPHSNLLQEVETIFNESVQEIKNDLPSTDTSMLSFKLKEANQICKKLGKPYEFMMQDFLKECGFEVVVLVKDAHHQMTATLSPTSFTEKLRVLRDIMKGEESSEVFDMGLVWERSEDVTCVPGFINRVRDIPALQNFSASLNFSLNTSSAFLTRATSSCRKRNSVLASLDQSISMNKPESTTNNSVVVSTVIHQILEHVPIFNPHTPAINNALNSVIELKNIAQSIRDHITEPGHSLSDGDLSEALIQLLLSSQQTVRNILTMTNSDIVTNNNMAIQLEEKLQRTVTKISNFTSRLYQGVKTEVESLIEEASSTLISLAQSVVSDIAKLAVLTDFPVPDVSKLKPGGILFNKFSDGIIHGLDQLVKSTCENISNAKVILTGSSAPANVSQTSTNLRSAALHASVAIEAFLDIFSQLSAALDNEEKASENEQRRKLVRWVSQIKSAAGTINSLDAAFTSVVKQALASSKGELNEEAFKIATSELMTRLQQLVAFAGLCPTEEEGSEYSSFMSLSDSDSSETFKESLQMLSKKSLLSAETLQHSLALSKTPRKWLGEKGAIKFNQKVLTQWPTNSNEYQIYLREMSERRREKMKSSLRVSDTPVEEKRVRFDVTSTTSSDYLDDSLQD
ncbi:hypothetical protein Pcinc_042000 [Petrolisthes cinctipes]|uniref:Kinesin motor domain-containing protein n=1 Tax=Petrolisthes cinctipes TaxID=88211 RepID=A0AAE1EH98_PETCI|nr:hypothetical protein Pcinc_042000 [Petrolisthes cinctipes]